MRSRALGSRDAEAARIFMRDVASRLTNRVQLTSDGHNTYLRAVWELFRSPNRPPPSLSRNTGRHRNRQAAIAPRNASAQRRSGGLALQTGSHQHIVRGASEPHDADAYTAVHAPNRWVQQEG